MHLLNGLRPKRLGLMFRQIRIYSKLRNDSLLFYIGLLDSLDYPPPPIFLKYYFIQLIRPRTCMAICLTACLYV